MKGRPNEPSQEPKEREAKTTHLHKKMVLKMEDLKKKTSSINGSSGHPTCLFVVQTTEPVAVSNQKDKVVTVLQIVHCLIHLAIQCIPCP
jgi:hypothetical protein